MLCSRFFLELAHMMRPNVPSGRLSLAERTGSSVTRPRRHSQRTTLQSGRNRQSQRLRALCVAAPRTWNACRMRPQWKTTKRCYRGIARLKYIAKCFAHLWLGGGHGALTIKPPLNAPQAGQPQEPKMGAKALPLCTLAALPTPKSSSH